MFYLVQVQDNSVSDEDVAGSIIKKFSNTNVVVSFAEIARATKAGGRNRLAAQVRKLHLPVVECNK